MDCGDGGVPVCGVSDEVLPEGCGGEVSWDDDRAGGREGCEEAGEEAVHVEEGHYEHGAVGGGEGVGALDVLHGAGEVAVGEGHGFGAAGGAGGVEDEGGVFGLCFFYGSVSLP